MNQRGYTDEETILAERYVSILDFVSRCAQGIDEGNYRYLWDKLRDLERTAADLRDFMSTGPDDNGIRGFDPPQARPDAVRHAVAHWGRHYRAARLLHPEARTTKSS